MSGSRFRTLWLEAYSVTRKPTSRVLYVWWRSAHSRPFGNIVDCNVALSKVRLCWQRIREVGDDGEHAGRTARLLADATPADTSRRPSISHVHMRMTIISVSPITMLRRRCVRPLAYGSDGRHLLDRGFERRGATVTYADSPIYHSPLTTADSCYACYKIVYGGATVNLTVHGSQQA